MRRTRRRQGRSAYTVESNAAFAPPSFYRQRGKGVVAVPDAELPALTAEQVRDTWSAFGVESGEHQPGDRRLRVLA